MEAVTAGVRARVRESVVPGSISTSGGSGVPIVSSTFNCGNCGQVVGRYARSCPHCHVGLLSPDLKCKCGFVGIILDFQNDVCPKCGGRVDAGWRDAALATKQAQERERERAKKAPKCPKCGKELSGCINNCPHCGYQITLPCKGCGKLIEWSFACPHCAYTPWYVALGGLFLSLALLVGGVFLILSRVEYGRLQDPTWHFWVGLCSVIGGFFAALVMLAAILKVLLDLIGVSRAGVLSRLIRCLVIFAILGSLPFLCFWAMEMEATRERELVKQAEEAFPDFTLAHFEQQLPRLISEMKNTEKFAPPFFAITHSGDSPDPSTKKGVWILVPEGTNRLEEAKTVLYIDKKLVAGKDASPPKPNANLAGEPIEPSSGQSKYTMTVCFIDRGNPQRKRIVELHQIVPTRTNDSLPYSALLEKAYAEARHD